MRQATIASFPDDDGERCALSASARAAVSLDACTPREWRAIIRHFHEQGVERNHAVCEEHGALLAAERYLLPNTLLAAAAALANDRDQMPRAKWVPSPKPSASPKPAAPKPVPPMTEDHSCGDPLKPDPSTASTLQELRELLRDFWEWSGELSSRRVAAASQGAFSHATVAKLLKCTDQVPLTLEYLRGMVLGCGGDSHEVARWVTAWRRIKKNQPAARRLRVVNE